MNQNCAAVSFGIESANVVGYQNIGFDKSGWMMNVGVQFSNIGAEGGAFTLDDAFFGNAAAEGDQVVTMNADAWDVNIYDKLGAGLGWVITPQAAARLNQLNQSVQPKVICFITSLPLQVSSLSREKLHKVLNQ